MNWRSGLVALFVGGIAAGLSYAVGVLLKNLVTENDLAEWYCFNPELMSFTTWGKSLQTGCYHSTRSLDEMA